MGVALVKLLGLFRRMASPLGAVHGRRASRRVVRVKKPSLSRLPHAPASSRRRVMRLRSGRFRFPHSLFPSPEKCSVPAFSMNYRFVVAMNSKYILLYLVAFRQFLSSFPWSFHQGMPKTTHVIHSAFVPFRPEACHTARYPAIYVRAGDSPLFHAPVQELRLLYSRRIRAFTDCRVNADLFLPGISG